MPGSFRNPSFRNYGKIDANIQMQLEQRRKTRNRCFVIVLSSIVLVAAIVGIAVGVTRSHKELDDSPETDNGFIQGSKAIQTACNTTLYPDVCVKELSSEPDAITANPRQLVGIAFKVALKRVQEAYASVMSVSGQTTLDDFERKAIADCLELFDDANDQLNDSFSGITDLNLLDFASFNQTIEDIKVWISTALSYQTVCTDGISNLTGNIPVDLLNQLEVVSESTINSLCLLDTFSKLGSKLSSWKDALPSIPNVHLRRLLSRESSSQGIYTDSTAPSFFTHSSDGEFPEWLSARDRKLLQTTPSSIVADIIVAQDGTGNYSTIRAALKHLPQKTNRRFVIHIKTGIYKEIFNITKTLANLTLIGDGIGATIITGNRDVAIKKFTTYQSATVGISAKGFVARGITFQNTAGAEGHQAVAVRAGADFIVFDSCSFEGYQDTLYALSSRQFYRSCKIYGTVDYIFGNAIAVFQNCELLARKPIQGQQITYTAQGRKLSFDVSGFSFQNCTLSASSELKNSTYPVLVYLGRPWKDFSRTVFLQCFLDSLIQPEGWLAWNQSNPFINTVYYGEYENRGPGSNTDRRIKWKGVHPVMSLTEALGFTVQNFIAGLSWLPQMTIPFQQSLSQ